MSHMKNRDSNKQRREDRQIQAKIRQESYDKLSLTEKLAAMPATGCVKQRAKLNRQLIEKLGKTVAPKHEATVSIPVEKPKKAKKVKKGQA